LQHLENGSVGARSDDWWCPWV